jgi:hypothetical protein
MTAARRALEELLVRFPSCRTYTRLAGASATDARDMAWAMAGARHPALFAAVPLMSAGLICADAACEPIPLPATSVWARNGSGTSVILPRNLPDGRCSDVLGGTAGGIAGGLAAGRLAAADLFASLPVALLEVA